MATGARQLPGAASRTSIATLPPEILQNICSLLQDPDDVASFHLVDTLGLHVSVLLSECSAAGAHGAAGVVCTAAIVLTNASVVAQWLDTSPSRNVLAGAGSVPQHGLHYTA